MDRPILTREPKLLASLAEEGGHERLIKAHFKGQVVYEGQTPVIDKPLVVLCFENRSGSNFLAAMMRASKKVHGLGEALNADTVVERATDWGVDTFPDYIARFAKTHKPHIGVKASWDQLLMLLRFNIPAMFNGLKLVYIRREDTLAQAVSRQIAFQTGKWTSETKVDQQIEPTFDATEIARHLAAVQRADQMFEVIFQVLQYDLHRVSYERLSAHPNRMAFKVMEFLGHDLGDWRPRRQIKLKRQANAINEAFEARFREEMMARIFKETGGDGA